MSIMSVTVNTPNSVSHSCATSFDYTLNIFLKQLKRNVLTVLFLFHCYCADTMTRIRHRTASSTCHSSHAPALRCKSNVSIPSDSSGSQFVAACLEQWAPRDDDKRKERNGKGVGVGDSGGAGDVISRLVCRSSKTAATGNKVGVFTPRTAARTSPVRRSPNPPPLTRVLI